MKPTEYRNNGLTTTKMDEFDKANDGDKLVADVNLPFEMEEERGGIYSVDIDRLTKKKRRQAQKTNFSSRERN